jgi:hypothetical protein
MRPKEEGLEKRNVRTELLVLGSYTHCGAIVICAYVLFGAD